MLIILKKLIEKKINASVKTISKSVSLSSEIEMVIKAISKCLKKGNKVVLFGNGGSAADAQHIAAELIGRY